MTPPRTTKAQVARRLRACADSLEAERREWNYRYLDARSAVDEAAAILRDAANKVEGVSAPRHKIGV